MKHTIKLSYMHGGTFRNEYVLDQPNTTYNIYTRFLVPKEAKLNITNSVIVKAPGCKVSMLASGVVYGKKSLAQIIDFREGCTGSAGEELEDVMLIDDAKNQSSPIIYCHEKDVSGSHAVKIHGPEDTKYLEARGISPEEALKMLINAKIKL